MRFTPFSAFYWPARGTGKTLVFLKRLAGIPLTAGRARSRSLGGKDEEVDNLVEVDHIHAAQCLRVHLHGAF